MLLEECDERRGVLLRRLQVRGMTAARYEREPRPGNFSCQPACEVDELRIALAGHEQDGAAQPRQVAPERWLRSGAEVAQRGRQTSRRVA